MALTPQVLKAKAVTLNRKDKYRLLSLHLNKLALGLALMLLPIIFLSASLRAQTPILERKISVQCQNCAVKKVLEAIEKAANFHFSYNSDLLDGTTPVSVDAKNQSVREVLYTVLGDEISYKEKGNHLILKQAKPINQTPSKSKYVVSGYIIDSRTGEKIAHASIYDNSLSYSAVSNEYGYYSMTLPHSPELVGLTYSRKDYLDTLILIRPTDDYRMNINLQKNPVNIDKPEAKPLQLDNPVEEVGLVKLIVPDNQIAHIENMSTLRQRFAQVSILPMIGTNTVMSGVTENKLSFNLFAGYSGAINGAEIGGFVNIVREDVKGFQAAGFGNITGGKTRGTQFAGFFNNNRGSMYGVQAAGFNNFVMDTIKGAQLAGFNNIIVGRLDGIQAAGFNNIATNNSDGIQLAGFSNVAVKDLNKAQISGFGNYAGNVKGLQAAGFMNITIGELTGTQIAGFMNVGRYVKGVQIAGFMNIAPGVMSGTQVSSMLNVGGKIKGTQLGFFNFADSVSGASIGFFSFVLHGYHEIEVTANEVFYLNTMFKTGTHKFYNIFAGSFYPVGEYQMYSLGYGIGTDFRLTEGLDMNLDLIGSQVNKNGFWTTRLNMLNKARLNLGLQLFKGVYFVFGPEFNIYVSQHYDIDAQRLGTPLAPYTLYDKEVRSTNVQMWIGGTGGLRF